MGKKIIIILLSCFIIGCSPNFCRHGSSACMNKLVGTYMGEVFAPSELQPSLTSFYLTRDGRLAGKYFINYTEFDKDYKINWVEGELTDVRPIGEYAATATWSDGAGKGTLRLLFTFDAKNFIGYWGFHQSEASSAWNGRKISDKPTITVDDIGPLIRSMEGQEAAPQPPMQSMREQQNYHVQKHDTEAPSDSFHRIFTAMWTDIANNNIGEALSYLDESVRKDWRDIFARLSPAQRNESVRTFLNAHISIDKLDDRIGQCHYLATVDSQQVKVYVNFKMDNRGEWKINYIGNNPPL